MSEPRRARLSGGSARPRGASGRPEDGLTRPSGGSAFAACVADVLGALGPGEVVSYGDVAAEAGYPGAARAVGTLLRHGIDGAPWWRVVAADGAIVSRHRDEQRALLEAEGVTVIGGRVRPWRRR